MKHVHQPRRMALLRSGAALALALVLGVLGLFLGEQAGERPGPTDAGLDGAQALPQVRSAQPGVSPASSAQVLAERSQTEWAPAATPERLPAPEPGQIVSPPGLDATATARADGGSVGSASATATVSPSASLSPEPEPAPDVDALAGVERAGVLLPHAALRPGGPGYRIQLGVFGDAGNALKLYEQVAVQGFEAQIQSRVVVGPFADRAAAEKARQTLRRAGLGAGVLVLPEPSK